MARRPTQRQVYEALEARFGGEIADAFEQVVGDLQSGVSLADVIRALEGGDIEQALRAFNLTDSAFRPLERSIALAYEAAGSQYASMISAAANQAGLRTVLRFDLRNPRAERWLSQMSSRSVTAILDDQRDLIRIALRAGMEAGRGPRNTALDIVGRVSRQTGRRVGGLVGLTGQQSGYVATARAELSSRDPAQLRNYLTRSLRDKRFDGAVRRAIEAGQAIDADTITRATGRYSDRLLKLRGDTIARTESLQALNGGRHQAFRQAVDDGLTEPDAVTKEWDSSGDGRVRDSHRGMDGQQVGIDQPFVSPSGARMMHPLDGSLGAPASEIIACRCKANYRIDHFRGIE